MFRRLPRHLALPAWGVLLAAVGGLLGACVDEEPSNVPVPEDVPVQITRGFTTTESDSGVVRFVFRAHIAKRFRDDVTRAEGIEVDFYEDGRVASTLTAEHGVLEEGRMTAEGNVVVRSSDGSTVLYTETLYWDDQEDKIRTDTYFRLVENGEELTGSGMRCDPDLDVVDVFDANARMRSPESP